MDTEHLMSPGHAEPETPAPTVAAPAAGLALRAYVWLVGLLAAVVGLVTVVTQRRSSQFFADDFLYLQLSRDGKLTPGWLAKDNYGHFAPITRLAYFAVQRTVGLDYGLASLLPAAVVTTIFVALAWLFTELLGRRPLALGLAVIGTASVPVVRTVLWWGAAIHVLGAAAMMTLCLAAFVAYCRRGHERYRIASLAALATGLLIQERPLLTIGYLVLIRYLFRLGLPPGRVTYRRLLTGEAAFWWPWFAVEAGYLVYRVFIFPSSPAPGDATGTIELIGQSVLRGYAPTLVGSRALAGSPLVTTQAVLGLLTLAMLTAVLAWKRRGAWRSVAFLVAVYVANLGIVAAGRLDVSSIAIIVADLQYYVDVHIATLLAFALGFAELPARDRTETPAAARRRTEATASSGLTRLVLPVALVALAVSTGITLRAIAEGNQQTAAHHYLPRVEAQLQDRKGPYELLRTKLPLDVAPSFIEPFTSVSDVFALDHQVADHLDPTADQRLVVTAAGKVVTAHPSTLVDMALDGPDAVARVGSIRQTSEGACLSGPAGSNILVKLPDPVASDGLFFALTYSSKDDHAVRPVMRGAGLAFNQNLTPLPAASDATVVDRLDGHVARSIVLGFDDPVHDLCLKTLWVGRISAEVASGCHVLTVYGEPARSSTDCSASWPVG